MKRVEELHGSLGDKIENRGRVGGKPGSKVGYGEHLRRWHAADKNEAVTEHLAHSNELLHVAAPILVADEVHVPLGEAGNALGRMNGVIAIVYDDADADRSADSVHVRFEAGLLHA